MSTKSTLAPQYSAQLADARKLFGLVHTREPGPTPERQAGQVQAGGGVADRHRVRHLVLAVGECGFEGRHLGPCVRKSERSTAVTAAMSLSSMLAAVGNEVHRRHAALSGAALGRRRACAISSRSCGTLRKSVLLPLS
jgi:hypothetical protein